MTQTMSNKEREQESAQIWQRTLLYAVPGCGTNSIIKGRSQIEMVRQQKQHTRAHTHMHTHTHTHTRTHTHTHTHTHIFW